MGTKQPTLMTAILTHGCDTGARLDNALTVQDTDNKGNVFALCFVFTIEA